MTKKNPKPDILPGDTENKSEIESMLRVNHAGEYGAKRIYQGQMEVLKNTPEIEVLKHMAEQEEVHLKTFAGMIAKKHYRPTALLPLWHILAYSMGAATALMGKKAAMACTVAVEEVIDEHYQNQLDKLKNIKGTKELQKTIAKFREEELEHRDIGLEHDAEKTPGYGILSVAIKAASKSAIWLSERV